MKNLRYLRGLDMVPKWLIFVAVAGIATTWGEPKPFPTYPAPVNSYLKRVQHGKQIHAFTKAKSFAAWQKQARVALIELIGLKQMEEELAAFHPKVLVGEADNSPDTFTRSLCSIETEPGVVIPFYLLVPKSANAKEPLPLIICPHGHDALGFHSYAGAFKDENPRKIILALEGNVAEQVALRGYMAIAPATRGLARELRMPDPRGRHGKSSCGAQLMHCLIAGRTPVAERVWDMQRLLDWAAKHPLVDQSRIVMTGNSGGGVLTAYTAAIDERIRVAIPSCSFTQVISDDGYIFHCNCCMVPGLRNWGDWSELGGLVAPRELLIVHGVNDKLHHRPTVEKVYGQVRKIYQAAGVPESVTMKWGDQGHRFYPSLMWPIIEKGLSEVKE